MKKDFTLNLDLIPYKVLVSMPQQHERRANAQRQFAELGMEVEWKIPVKLDDIDWKILPEIYRVRPKYASQTLTLIEVFEEARRRNVSHFAHFEDDIVFHPDVLSLLPQINVPEDWKFIYLGGRNWGPKKYVSQGIVKPHYVYDLHAAVIRTDMIDLLKQILLDPAINSHWADSRIALLHKTCPTYLCRPNLAWQSAHTDDAGGALHYSNYLEDGSIRAGQGD